MTNFFNFFFISLQPLALIVLSQQTGLEPYCDYIFFKRALYCFRFTSLDQLDFSNSTLEYQELVIQPNSDLKLEFNSSLNLQGLKLTRNARIEIGNFYAFDPFFQPFGSIQISNPNKIFSFYILDSNIFFVNNVTCTFSEEERQNSYIFSGLNLNRLQFSNVNFTSELCPLLFKNTSVQDWYFINKDPVKYDPSLNSSLIQMDLNIKVKRLFVEYGADRFISTVNTETLLNEFIFEQVEEIYFFSCNLEQIDGESMAKFSNLNRISLMQFDLENFLTKGLEWMKYLNRNSSKYFDIVLDGKLFPYHDSDLCLFSHFPFENKIIALFDLELDSPDFFLPCSCVIYWLHKNYLNYSHLVKNDSRYSNLLPFHCLDQDPILIEDQNIFCDNENSVLQCGLPSSQNITHPPPQGVNQSCFFNPDENGKLCTCNIGSINILECSSKLISSVPNDLSSPSAWDYVSFKASSIRVIDSFQNLTLNLAATVLVSEIQNFGTDIFSNILTKNIKFRFVIENSVLNLTNFSFRFTKFSSFEFKNCLFKSSLSSNIFEGSEIDSLVIDQIELGSEKPSFYSQSINEIKVKKIKILNFFHIFPPGLELDSNLLNPWLFKDTTEIQIVNSALKSINSSDLSRLPLKNIRLDNINFGNILDSYFKVLPNLVGNNPVNLNDSKINWLWSKNIEKVYFGNNNLLKNNLILNDTICFYAGLNPHTRLYFYENLNQPNGLECTCEVYWIYRSIDFAELASDPDSKYIPSCVINLNNTSELNKKVEQCFASSCSPAISCQNLANVCPTNQLTTQEGEISNTETGSINQSVTKVTDIYSNGTTTRFREDSNNFVVYLAVGLSVVFVGAVGITGWVIYRKKSQMTVKDIFSLEKL